MWNVRWFRFSCFECKWGKLNWLMEHVNRKLWIIYLLVACNNIYLRIFAVWFEQIKMLFIGSKGNKYAAAECTMHKDDDVHGTTPTVSVRCKQKTVLSVSFHRDWFHCEEMLFSHLSHCVDDLSKCHHVLNNQCWHCVMCILIVLERFIASRNVITNNNCSIFPANKLNSGFLIYCTLFCCYLHRVTRATYCKYQIVVYS